MVCTDERRRRRFQSHKLTESQRQQALNQRRNATNLDITRKVKFVLFLSRKVKASLDAKDLNAAVGYRALGDFLRDELISEEPRIKAFIDWQIRVARQG